MTYARIVVNYQSQQKDPNCVRIPAGGNLPKVMYTGELTTHTSNLTTLTCMWNSVIGTPWARFACTDASSFYLAAPLEHFQYMEIPVHLIPQEFIDLYQLKDKIRNTFVYCKFIHRMYGIREAGVLANKIPKECLETHDCAEVNHTPGLFKHLTQSVWSTLTVDHVGIKYIGKHNVLHLVNVLKSHYNMEMDWTGGLYCGITLK